MLWMEKGSEGITCGEQLPSTVQTAIPSRFAGHLEPARECNRPPALPEQRSHLFQDAGQ